MDCREIVTEVTSPDECGDSASAAVGDEPIDRSRTAAPASKPVTALQTHKSPQPLPAREAAPSLAHLEERTLVLLPASDFAETLVRHIRPLTHGIRGPFRCLHVNEPGKQTDQREELALRSAFYLARSLGGEVMEVDGDSVEQVAVRIAAEMQATHILVGMSKRQRIWPFRGATLSEKLVNATNATVLVVAEPQVG